MRRGRPKASPPGQGRRRPPAFAVVDLRLSDGSGLDIVTALRSAGRTAGSSMLTGYGNIATAVAAIKARRRSTTCRSRPTPTRSKRRCWRTRPDLPPPPEQPMTADRVRWEHIQRVFEQCDRNVSETARRLRMHRRTLQRILAKHAPRG